MRRRTLILSGIAAMACAAARAEGPVYRALGGAIFSGGGAEFRLADILAADDRAAPHAGAARRLLDRLLAAPPRIEDVAPPDRWGRRIVRAFDASGASLQELLIAAGAARTRPEGQDFDFIRQLFAREQAAREAGAGLWGLRFYRVRDSAGADDAIGGFHLVEGAVLRAGRGGGRLYLNFGEDFRSDFTATAKTGAARRWKTAGLIDLENLGGARIRVRGHVASINGPSIEISHPLQVELIGSAT
jgi:hypothetical protein